jgi:hypothetical protein
MWYIETGDGEYKKLATEEVVEYAKKHKVVQQDNVGELFISTVWLGLDHGWGKGEPLIYETMIFNADFEELFCMRYSRWNKAINIHVRVVALCENLKNKIITEEEFADGINDCRR